MAGERTTVARPYAKAIYGRAKGSGTIERWSETLDFLVRLVAAPEVQRLIGDPNLGHDGLLRLLLEIGEGRLDPEARNLLRLLVKNHRLSSLSEIARLYERLRCDHEGVLDVEISSAFAIAEEQRQALATALERRLGKRVRITTREEPALIGGVKIRAGDLVIDGSLRHKIARLATGLGV